MTGVLILVSLICGLIAMIGEIIVPIFLGKKYAGYSQLKNAVSELGSPESPVRKYMSIWLIIIGISFFILSIGQSLLFSSITGSHMWYLIALIVFGIAGILAGIFPEDSEGNEETASGKIHGISSGMGFLFLILAPIWANGIPEFINLLGFYLFYLIACGISFIIFVTSKDKEGIWGLTGLWQRINIIIVYSHLIINYIISMI